MKRRWSVLFWSSLGSLIGMSLLAKSFGLSLTDLLGISLVGMVIATSVALFALVREIPLKWPAAVVLVCAGPMALDCLRALPYIASSLRFLGVSYAIVIVGAIATVTSAITILTLSPPRPPTPPPVAPARVVD